MYKASILVVMPLGCGQGRRLPMTTSDRDGVGDRVLALE